MAAAVVMLDKSKVKSVVDRTFYVFCGRKMWLNTT